MSQLPTSPFPKRGTSGTYIYANETILFRLQFFQCSMKIHFSRSNTEYKTNTKIQALNISTSLRVNKHVNKHV